jgi:Protein of unknwon function (DUF3310)
MQPKPFTMTKELEAKIDADLAQVLENPHDAPGAIFGAPSVRRGKVDKLHSESPPPRPEDYQPADPPEDPINPSHYRRHPSGIECIDVTRHLNFNIGNAIKYLWRHMDKGTPIDDLKKAQWYIDDEIRRLEGKR